MIIQENKNDIMVDGESSSKKATISAQQMAKLQYLLTEGLYKDPITAVIAEWTNNGVDSIIQAGKSPVDNPVIVKIEYINKQYTFSVEDKGIGLDNRDFEDICMNYLESTKDRSNKYIGSFGIGMKSFLALERSATFICRKDGKERMYVVYKGEEFVNYDMVYEKDTDQGDGVKATLVINDYSEKNVFEQKAIQKLAYYETVLLYIDSRVISNNIYRNELFQWSSVNNNSSMHLCLKDVYYSIDWEALGMRQIYVPVALRFGLDSGITPTPSRESYISNEKVKIMLKERICKVAEWFVNKYNENHKPYDNFRDAYDKIGWQTISLKMEGAEFIIDPLLQYTTIIPKELRIEGIDIYSPSFYKGETDNFFFGYDTVSLERKHHKKKKWTPVIEKYFFEDIANKVVIVDSFSGHIREYLKNKYEDALFVRKNMRERCLGFKKEESSATSYYSILNLFKERKERWRAIIKEWQYVVKSVTDLFPDESKCDTTLAFQKWLDEKRFKQKERRRLGYTSGYNTLNKQVGDVTLAYYSKVREWAFRKKAHPISGLSSNKFLTVMLKEEDKGMFNHIFSCINNKNIAWALVGNLEIKKVPKHYQFINFQQFIMSKPFSRIASAILFRNLLLNFKAINTNASGIFENCLQGYVEKAEILKKYVEDNLKDIEDDAEKAILEVAREKDLFDKFHWEEYLYLKQGVEKYDWITCLREPRSWEKDELKKYKTLINQVLLFRKKYYNEFPEGATVVILEKEIVTITDPKEKEEDEEFEEEEEEFDDEEYDSGLEEEEEDELLETV